MKKMTIIERSKFAQLVRDYKKALHIISILEYYAANRIGTSPSRPRKFAACFNSRWMKYENVSFVAA